LPASLIIVQLSGKEKGRMSTLNTSILNDRKFRVSLFVVLAVVALAGAAYLWGSRLDADTLQANTLRSSEASVARYGSSLGISAVRAADASASRGSSLRGVPAMRAVNQTDNALSPLSVAAKTQGLSNLELRRAKAHGIVRREPDVAPGR
jgi:hypothetical protein